MSGITTTVGNLPQYIATATVPALTTIFTPPASFSCSNRYVAADTPGIAWSTYSRDGYSPPVDPIYYSCLPARLRGPHYSPGVCTSGQTIASMTKYEAGSRTMWQAQCCKRCDMQLDLSRDYTNASLQWFDDQCSNNTEQPSTNVRKRYLNTACRPRSLHHDVYQWQLRVFLRTSHKRPIYRLEYDDDDKGNRNSRSAVCCMGSVRPLAVSSRICNISSTEDWRQVHTNGHTRIWRLIWRCISNRLKRQFITNNPDSGLSGGAKIGIGIGAGVGAALLISFIAMFFVTRRMRRRNHAVAAYPNESTPAMDGHGAGLAKNKWYQRTPQNEEIELNSGPNELDSFPVQYVPGAPVELEGSQIPRGRY
jgi:hypothetical protein